ncbi:MAG: tRNA (adenosine(37)-N6)-threonylcarbamoyltransferase complex dimerization subunit type 1 TsaB [Rickettsiales bacterium]|jgi:tRNA threonylcarbamoyl adenosine modification protein YeaZ|nr:tRNA (adenosine(37)-N6)-threonylcarbamoyltransferase complex dimerization subunit type 1 TsaB [Rickettsiales bacterium]
MKTLYIDTSGEKVILCSRFDGTVKEAASEGAKSQNEEFFPLLRSFLDGTKIADLDLIVVISGPGSFTGIRLGLAAAKGFAIGAKTPVIALDAFKAMWICGARGTLRISAGENESFQAELDDAGALVGEYGIVGEASVPAVINPPQVLEYFEKTFDKAAFVETRLEPLYIRPHYAQKSTC